MMNRLKYSILASMLSISVSVSADVISDAKNVIDNAQDKEDYESALLMLQGELKAKQKPNVASDLKFWAGKCCYLLNRYEEAAKYFEASTSRHNDAYHYLAKIGFMTYDFDMSSDAYEDYEEALEKGNKKLPKSVAKEIDRLNSAQSMLDRVESIVVIDSINVSREQFFKHYRIAASSGKLKSMDEIEVKTSGFTNDQPFYINENNEFMLWSDKDSTEYFRLYESAHLNDGSWHDPVLVDFGNDRCNYDSYPFMMSDGSTLYFASDGEGSIGGYDIFCSNRDSETHEYMMPQNMGMPYNSPHNDFMLAIDEENGVGWWATDRNSPNSDTLTIYVFIPNEVRINRSIDDPNIVAYAKVSDYKLTWEEDADYSDILQTINQIDISDVSKEIEFEFPISSSVVYQNYDDFKTHEGAELMRQYVKKNEEFSALKEKLSQLRKDFGKSRNPQLVDEIKRVKMELIALHDQIKDIKNNIYKAEKSTQL